MIQHRHLTAEAGWSKAAIDSVLERGSLAEWQKLFAAAGDDADLSTKVLEVARCHPLPGVLPIVEHLVRKAWPTPTAKG